MQSKVIRYYNKQKTYGISTIDLSKALGFRDNNGLESVVKYILSKLNDDESVNVFSATVLNYKCRVLKTLKIFDLLIKEYRYSNEGIKIALKEIRNEFEYYINKKLPIKNNTSTAMLLSTSKEIASWMNEMCVWRNTVDTNTSAFHSEVGKAFEYYNYAISTLMNRVSHLETYVELDSVNSSSTAWDKDVLYLIDKILAKSNRFTNREDVIAYATDIFASKYRHRPYVLINNYKKKINKKNNNAILDANIITVLKERNIFKAEFTEIIKELAKKAFNSNISKVA